MMITEKTPIIEAIHNVPGALEIFTRHGMGCIGCMSSAAATISSGAKAHGIDVKLLLDELNANSTK